MSAQWSWTELAASFEQASNLLGDYDPHSLLERLRGVLAQSVQDNFDGSHAPDGSPWAPPKNPRSGHKLLVKTGDLLQAAVDEAWNAVITRDGLLFDDSRLPFYAEFHRRGTRNMPARPFFGISVEFSHQAHEMLAQDVLARMLPDG